MDEGWTRWVFDKYRVPFTTINEKDVAAGSLNDKFDAILLPDQQIAQLTRALGDAGTAALGTFVDGGGTLLAFNDASAFAADALKLPVKNVLEGVKNTEFYAPGSIFGVEVNKASPLASGLTAPVPAVWFEDSPTFEITDPASATAVLTYPATGNALLSGWLLGAPKLNGKAAMVDVKRGKGHVVLYGFRPQYRGQSNATFPLIWAAIAKPSM
ncbi:MAG: hypothetical protein ACJ79C_05095 [Myxococcales bacterium]